MTNKDLAIPSGVITGVVVLAVVGIATIAGVALKAGIKIGLISRKHADKKSDKTGEWVEPNIPEALTDALGKFMAKGTVNAGKKIILHGTKQTGRVIGNKFGIPAGVTSTVATDIVDFFNKLKDTPADENGDVIITTATPVDDENVTDSVVTDDDISDIIKSIYLDGERPFAEFSGTEIPFVNIEEETFPTITIETPTIEEKAEPVLPKVDFTKAKGAIANALTEDNIELVLKTVSANKGRLLNALNKKFNEPKK